MDETERLRARVTEKRRLNPDASPVALLAQVLAEDADSLAAEAHQRGNMAVASKLDRCSAEMDKLAASRPRRSK